MRHSKFVAAACGLAVSIATLAAHAASADRVQVVLTAKTGSSVFGILDVAAVAEGVSITGTVRGFSPQTRHGMAVYEKGDCSAPDASSAGEHLNPAGVEHGDPARAPHHVGDLPNIDADANGVAVVNLVVKGVRLDDSATGLLNRALIVRARADDFRTQPSGGAGPRVACGVIGAGKS